MLHKDSKCRDQHHLPREKSRSDCRELHVSKLGQDQVRNKSVGTKSRVLRNFYQENLCVLLVRKKKKKKKKKKKRSWRLFFKNDGASTQAREISEKNP